MRKDTLDGEAWCARQESNLYLGFRRDSRGCKPTVVLQAPLFAQFF